MVIATLHTYLPRIRGESSLTRHPLGHPMTVKRSRGSTNADPTFPRHCQFINFLVSQIGVLTDYFKKRWADAAGNEPLRTITARRTLEEPRLRTRFQAYMDYINTLAAQFPYGDEDPDPLILPQDAEDELRRLRVAVFGAVAVTDTYVHLFSPFLQQLSSNMRFFPSLKNGSANNGWPLTTRPINRLIRERGIPGTRPTTWR